MCRVPVGDSNLELYRTYTLRDEMVDGEACRVSNSKGGETEGRESAVSRVGSAQGGREARAVWIGTRGAGRRYDRDSNAFCLCRLTFLREHEKNSVAY